MNIIRVLVVKLRQSQASDIEQTRKAVRAAIVLLPLLGITNLLHLVPALKTAWKFALWSYSTYFLTSFQGFFIALIYCFLNGEVSADQPALVQSRVAISLSLSLSSSVGACCTAEEPDCVDVCAWPFRVGTQASLDVLWRLQYRTRHGCTTAAGRGFTTGQAVSFSPFACAPVIATPCVITGYRRPTSA